MMLRPNLLQISLFSLALLTILIIQREQVIEETAERVPTSETPQKTLFDPFSQQEESFDDEIAEEQEEESNPMFISTGDNEEEIEESTDVDGSITYSEPAPRTHRGEYNEIKPLEKYFIYSPSGGFNNQREELEYAVEIGRLLNRTVYIPMAARHTNFFQSYERLSGSKDLFPMDRIIDFPYLEKYGGGVHLVPLNITLRRFVGRFIKQQGENNVETLFHPERPSEFETWHRPEVLNYRNNKKKLLFFRGRGIYHKWFADSVMNKLKRYVRYSKYLRDLSMKITKQAFGSPFYAMHIRMGDYKRSYDSPYNFISNLVRLGRSKKWKMRKFPVYVATDDVKKSGEDFGSIYTSFEKVLFANNVPKELVAEYRELFPPDAGLRNDMMGILEQLICTQAIDFVGTPTSTFSAWIVFMRAIREYTFPELGAVVIEESDHSNNNNSTL